MSSLPNENESVKKKRGRPKKEKSEDGCYRIWTFVIYPDSWPENWLGILRNLHVECCVSPLHDRDVNADETEKKEHRHVLLAFDGKKSYSQVKEISQGLLNGTIPQRVNSLRGMVRYFVHLDNPEKAPYDIEDIISICGFDVEAALDVSGALLRQTVRDMELYIHQNEILEYSDFSYWCLTNNTEWHTVLTEKRTLHFKTIFNSMRGKNIQEKKYQDAVSKNADFYENIIHRMQKQLDEQEKIIAHIEKA